MKNPRERNDSGVSEVMGTILTLGITVTLFSTVFLMLGNLPEPTGTTYADFDMSVKHMPDKTVWINITHTGGETLRNASTRIYLFAGTSNNTVYQYSIWNGLSKKYWKPGETWTYHNKTTEPIDLVSGYIYIFDTTRNTIIWREYLAGGTSTPLPPIIMDRGTTPTTVSRSSSFQVYAYVKDPNGDFNPDADEGSSLTSNLSFLNLHYENGTSVHTASFHHDVGYRYVTDNLRANATNPGTYIAQITAVDNSNNSARENVRVIVETPSSNSCEVYVAAIDFYPAAPVSGETTQIRVTFGNNGSSPGYIGKIKIYDKTFSTTLIENNKTLISVAAGGESYRTYVWNSPSPSGIHTLNVSFEMDAYSPEDGNLSDNYKVANVSVLPKILLVDDDHNNQFNTANYLKEALNSTGYSYDIYTVASKTDDGPHNNTLRKYDVVIWICGLDGSNALTKTDVKSLETFMNPSIKGKLWLIGENILDYAGTSDGSYVADFLNDYLGVSGRLSSPSPSLPLKMDGSGALSGLRNITVDSTGYLNGENADYIQVSSGYMALNDTSNNHILAVNQSENGHKSMFFSFEFSAIKYSSDRAQVAYKVLKWLSGIDGRTGSDIAISGISIEPEYPLYGESVNITLHLRNNGWSDENVTVQLIIDGISENLHRSNVYIRKNGGTNITWTDWMANRLGKHLVVGKVDPYNEIAESDETNNVYSTEFIVRFRTLIVDDDDSKNNGGTQADWNRTITDSFDHLLSSDTQDSNYSGTADIYVVKDQKNGPTYDNLSHYNAVIWITGNDSDHSFTYPDMENISDYVDAGGMLWIIGDGFIDDLKDGVSGASPSDISNFLNEIGIQNYSLNGASGFNELVGTLNDKIGHGIDFTTASGRTANSDEIWPYDGAKGILSADTEGQYVAVKKSDENTGSKVVVFTFDPNATTGLANYYPNPHFQIPADIANRTTYELSYLVMHWFGQININPELKVGSDMYINGEDIDKMNLVLGNSYVLEAKVHNVGQVDVIYATVRFYDGTHIIGTGSVAVSADDVSTVSMIWTPAYAGAARPIRVIIDYHEGLSEIPNPKNLTQNLFEYNNEAVHYVPVYFFWDDMENGTANWRHTANVVNINGEDPIDFLGAGYTNVYTDVIYNWNETRSHGGVWTDDVFHSYNRSYWLKEPSPTGVPIDQIKTQIIPIDVVFAIDNSGSMKNNNKWTNAKKATEDFIKNLTDKDRAAIWVFGDSDKYNYYDDIDDSSGDSSDPRLLCKAAYMTDANKNSFINTLESISADQDTPFYDAVGDAIQYLLEPKADATDANHPSFAKDAGGPDADTDNSDNSRLEFVIGLTDGESNDDECWTPKTTWGNTILDDTYGNEHNKHGLLQAPPMAFTIGISLGTDHDDNYPTAPSWSHTTSPDPSSYEKEYDLWHVADSSTIPYGRYGRDYNASSIGYSAMSEFNDPDPNIGHYYYTTDSSELKDIFKDIREMAQSIASGNGQATGNGNVTRSGDSVTIDSGTRSGGGTISPLGSSSQTMYMRSDEHTVNTLKAYKLNTTQSSTYQDNGVSGSTYKGYWGAKVWIMHSDGTKTLISGGIVANVSRSSYSDEEGIQSATWTCPEQDLSSTDAIEVKIFYGDSNPPSNLAAKFITDQLNEQKLSSSTWTFYYYTELYYGDVYFYWGDSSHNSRIEGISFCTSEKPAVLEAYPADGKTALPSQYVAVVFDSSMDTDTSKTPTLTQNSGTSVTYTFEGWFSTNHTDDTAIWSHDNWTSGASISLKVSGYTDTCGITGSDYSWSFNVYIFTAGGGSGGSTETNTNKTAVTESFDLSNVNGAVLTFWHKYSIVPGTNGAFIELGYKNDSGNWQWIYMIPGQGAYTGNMNLSATRKDSEGTNIVWAWNGVSGKGTFGWDFVKVDLMQEMNQHNIAQAYRNEIRVKFNYTQYGLGTGYGWYIDDVKVVVSRSDDASVAAGDSDVWQLVNTTYAYGDAHSGTHAWWNGNSSNGYFKEGIDNSLISRPIDITNAWNATLSAYFKFNINTTKGAPPDGFRVEISKDNGGSWTAINLGVRSAWGVSGTNNSADKTYTGTNAGNNWTEAGSLLRLNVDLTAFRGNIIMLRFRVTTTNADTYQHYDEDNGWGGFYLDDVVISGESLP